MIKKLRGPNFRTKTSDDQSSELQEYKSKLDAISRSQAVIEFELDGTIIKANGNFLSALGYELSEIVGEHHRIFIDAVERQSAEYREFWPSLASGQANSGQFKRIRKDGEPIFIDAMYFPLLDVDGKPYKVVKFASDVTDQGHTADANSRRWLGSL